MPAESANAIESPRPASLAESARSSKLTVVSTPLVQGRRLSGADFERVVKLAVTGILVTTIQATPAVFVTAERGALWPAVLAVVSLVQLGYVLWMLSVPCVLSVNVLMIVYGVAAGIGAVLMGFAALSPSYQSMPWGLDSVRESLVLWCLAMLTLNTAVSAACAIAAHRWQAEAADANADDAQLTVYS